MDPVLHTKNLEVGYPTGRSKSLTVLEEISTCFHLGEMVCLMGPNGIGKSTLIKTIAGLLNPIHGQIYLNNRSFETYSAKALAREISVVLTSLPFVGNFTVEQVVQMGRYPFLNWLARESKEDERIIEKAIELATVGPIRKKKFYTLSDGQKQKTLLARAIAQNGSILILDEPTSHLDLNNRVEIMNVLRNLSHQENKSIIISTHEMDLALQMADRLLLITTEGKLESGIPEDLVLNETIDKTFKLKGYDLKRGKVSQRKFLAQVKLEGEDYPYLWTKNALERTRIEVVDEAEIRVKITNSDPGKQNNLQWEVVSEDETLIVDSVESLVMLLKEKLRI